MDKQQKKRIFDLMEANQVEQNNIDEASDAFFNLILKDQRTPFFNIGGNDNILELLEIIDPEFKQDLGYYFYDAAILHDDDICFVLEGGRKVKKRDLKEYLIYKGE